MHARCAKLGVVALLTGCASGPRLEQPVGATHNTASLVSVLPTIPLRSPKTAAAPHENELKYRVCALPDTAVKAPHFPTNSFMLRPRGRQILDQIAHCMLDGTLAHRSIVIYGYADPRGSDAYNSKLALERARRVARYLERRGVPACRLSVVSRGEHYARGKGPEGWQLDRRVEIALDTGKTVVIF